MYADDIILLADTHERAQHGLDILSDWCTTWGMKVNIKKTQVVHQRNPRHPRCNTPLTFCGSEMEYVSNYKYLGCWINEFDKDDKTVEALTATAGCSFGHIVDIFRKVGDLGHKSFNTLYVSYVLPLANYATAVWGFKDHPATWVLQNRIHRFYLGVHRFASVTATSIEMDQPLIRTTHWLEMLRFHNRIIIGP